MVRRPAAEMVRKSTPLFNPIELLVEKVDIEFALGATLRV